MGLSLSSLTLKSSHPTALRLFISSVFDCDIDSDEQGEYLLLGGFRIYAHYAENSSGLDLGLNIDFNIEELQQRIAFFNYRNPELKVKIISQEKNRLELSLLDGNNLVIRRFSNESYRNKNLNNVEAKNYQ